MFLLWLRQLPWCGDRTPASVLPPTEGRSSPSNTPVFPPSSFILPSFVWVYIFFSTGQVLLSALSWCSACTSMSEGVFLMYPWRDVLHVHLLLRHLVPISPGDFNKSSLWRLNPWKWLQLLEWLGKKVYQKDRGGEQGDSDCLGTAHESVVGHVLSMCSTNAGCLNYLITLPFKKIEFD